MGVGALLKMWKWIFRYQAHGYRFSNDHRYNGAVICSQYSSVENEMAEVVIYTRNFCGFCTAAKRLLDSKGVSYTEHDASFSNELRKEMIQRAHGKATFPQIFVGKRHVGGCDELHELERRGKLDDLLRSAA